MKDATADEAREPAKKVSEDVSANRQATRAHAGPGRAAASQPRPRGQLDKAAQLPQASKVAGATGTAQGRRSRHRDRSTTERRGGNASQAADSERALVTRTVSDPSKPDAAPERPTGIQASSMTDALVRAKWTAREGDGERTPWREEGSRERPRRTTSQRHQRESTHTHGALAKGGRSPLARSTSARVGVDLAGTLGPEAPPEPSRRRERVIARMASRSMASAKRAAARRANGTAAGQSRIPPAAS